jgi:DNA-binding transcriptional MerR regulator
MGRIDIAHRLGDLEKAKFGQPEVIEVTGLDPGLLQTWVNRGLITLTDQNPGTGRRRLYCALDIVRLSIMQRLTSVGISVGQAKARAFEVTSSLKGRQLPDENQRMFIRYGKHGLVDQQLVSKGVVLLKNADDDVVVEVKTGKIVARVLNELQKIAELRSDLSHDTQKS